MTPQDAQPAPDDPASGYRPPNGYRPPRLTRLGTLTELTQGGSPGPGDGIGGAGDAAS